MEYLEAIEAIRLLRAGLTQPWSWREWNDLPAGFTGQLLDTWNIVVEMENQQNGQPTSNRPKESDMEEGLAGQSSLLKS